MKPDLWARLFAHFDRLLTMDQEDALRRYQQWLEEEAIPAGGVAAGDLARLDERHIADSLLFYAGWDDPIPPADLWDLASGVGLPGIPLAILLPECAVTLVDRSRRRTDLAKRACRVLGLDNVKVLQADIGALQGSADLIVSRAGMSPGEMTPLIRRHLHERSRAVAGGSWISRPTPPPGWEVREIPREWLDRPIWLLIMRG